ncbi:MAG: ATP-binding protein [Bacteroidota bacterium]
MIDRILTKSIDTYLKDFPAVAILGPRQVGKTTLVKKIKLKKKIVYLDLEKQSDFALLKNNAEDFLMSNSSCCVIIDEVQRMPELFPLLRALIDDDRKPARFILTGSASPDLIKGVSESLAGRIIYTYLHPINAKELTDKTSISKHWLRGGFPNYLLAKNPTSSLDWMDSFITTYIEKDLPFLFDIKFSSVTMRKLWTMLAHLSGEILNIEDLARSLDISGTTVKRYLDYLEAAFIINRLPAFFINTGKRLVKAPKVYLSDTGIVNYLLGIEQNSSLLTYPKAGNLWETYIVNQLYRCKHNRQDLHFYRTHSGAEVDIVIARGHMIKALVEIKLSKAPQPTKGLFIAMQDLDCKNVYIIGNVTDEYELQKGIKVVNIKIFLDKYFHKLF